MQYEEQVKQQELIAEISADFVRADEVNIDTKISGLLQRCGEYFQADHVYIINHWIVFFRAWNASSAISTDLLISSSVSAALMKWL